MTLGDFIRLIHPEGQKNTISKEKLKKKREKVLNIHKEQ